MSIYDIIEGLNIYYESFPNRKKGYFVPHQTVEANPVVKILKKYEVKVYFVQDKDRTCVFGAQITDRITSDTEKSIILPKLATLLTQSLLEYINTQDFKELCN